MSDGEVSKSILHSDIYKRLKDSCRLVFLVHKNKADYFSKLLTDEAHVEIMPRARSLALEEFFLDLFLYSVPTESIRVKIEHSYASGGSLAGRAIKYVLWSLGHFKAYRMLCRFAYRIVKDRTFDALFEKYTPDVVFAANLTAAEDARLLKAAHERKIPTIGMPKGWDNLTLKTLIPVFPDQLLVQTPLLKSDAENLDYPQGRIRVVGFPKFDVYADRSNLLSRDDFCRTFNLDPSRKLILYAGAGDVLAPHDEEILTRFLRTIESGGIKGSPQVIVRPHPKYVYRAEVLPQASFWALDRPGTVVGTRAMDFEFTKGDVSHLMNSLFHADLLVHTASTLGVEAAIFDKPTITIGYEEEPVLPALSTARYYRYEHYDRVLKTGGMKCARSFEDLARFTNEYLERPDLDREGRTKIVENNAYRIDGKAGARVAEAILRMVEK